MTKTSDTSTAERFPLALELDAAVGRQLLENEAIQVAAVQAENADLRRRLQVAEQSLRAVQQAATAESQARQSAEALLESELADTKLLQSFSAEIMQSDSWQSLYDKIMDAAVSIMRSDFASMQMLHPERGECGELRLLACRGYDLAAAKFWEWVRADSGCTCGVAMRIGRRAVADDVRSCAFMAGSADRENALRMGMLAMQSTPLIARNGNLVGMISTHWKQTHTPSERDLRLLDILARQAADLLERRRIEQERAAESEALSDLNVLSSRLWQMHNQQDGLNEMLGATMHMLGADLGNIQILDDQRGVLTIEAQRGFESEFLEHFREVTAQDDSACGRSLRSGERIMIEDVEADPLYAPLRDVARRARYRGVQSTPLIGRDGAPLGMISTHWHAPHRPTELEFRRLDLYARQASNFIERCKADQILNDALHDTQLLHRLTVDMSQPGDTHELYGRVVEAASEIMRSDFASMQMYCPERGTDREWLLLGHRNFTPEAAQRWKWISAAGNTSCSEALRTQKRFMISDIETSEFLADGDEIAALRQTGIRAMQTTPLKSSAGKLIGMVSTHWSEPHEPSERDLQLLDILARQAADLLERNKAEAALRAAHARLQKVLEVETVGVMYWDLRTGCMTEANDTFLKMMGYTRAEVTSGELTWQRLTPPEYMEASLAEIERFQQYGRVGPYEKEYLRSDGARQWLVFAGSALDDHTCVEFCVDIAARKQAEEALREADRRKNEFLAMLAHELCNPLAPIRNSAQVMRLTSGQSESVTSAAEMMERQVGQMVRLVDDLLDVSRLSRGKIELRNDRVELGAVINQAVEAVRPHCNSNRLQLTVTLPPKPIILHADHARVAQVVGNLLHNACKFTKSGGQVWLTVEQEHDQAVIQVRDSGIGIAPDQLPRIFDMFMQIDTSLERSTSGLGIGLTLVKNLVEMHAGVVEAHSEGIGYGSTFVVRLPILIEAPPAEPLPPANGAAKMSTVRRILVVDDNQDSAKSLAVLLKLTGNETHTAYDGLEAVDEAARLNPDVVLLDIGLPKLNGYEACGRIREQPWGKAMHLIALTGWGQDEDREKTRAAGFDAHMVKPVAFDALMKHLAETNVGSV